MKSLKPTAVKYLILLFTVLFTSQTFAQNVVDSDLSNGAGSNSGHSHLGFYVAIVLLLVVSVVVAYTNPNSKTDDNA